MNYIKQIFDRCNIETLCEFLIHGSELTETSNYGYYERSRKAEKRLSEWLHKQFADSKELDEHGRLIFCFQRNSKYIYADRLAGRNYACCRV